MIDVITIGSATRDVFLKSDGFEIRKHADSPTGVEQCFPLGAKIEVKDVVFATGGGGTNAAVTFSRQGLKTGCVGVIGNDFNGKELLKELKNEKVKPFFVVHKDDFTAYSVILVHPNAERTILSYKGEGQHFDAEAIPWRKLKAKWFFFDSLGGSFELLQKAFEHATARNFKIAFNPGGKELAHGLEKLKPHLAEVDIFSVNKEEGESLLGTPNNSSAEDVLAGLDKLVKGIVVLTLGPDGVLVSDKQKIYPHTKRGQAFGQNNEVGPRYGVRVYKAGTPDSPRVERTGAGDAFVSGFVSQYILSEGDRVESQSDHAVSIVKSIQFATANASSVVAQYGPKAGILEKGDFGPWPLVTVTS